MPTTFAPKSAEFSRVVRRVIDYPNGVAFLREAPLETVAVTLRLHPFVVEAARLLLEQPGGLDYFSTSGTATEAADDDSDAYPQSVEAEALLETARQSPTGIADLCEVELHEAAAAFAVHPYIILRARGALERAELCRRNTDRKESVTT